MAEIRNIANTGMDYLSFVFDHAGDTDESKPAYIDAEEPHRVLTAKQTKFLVRRFIAGFKSVGLSPGDPVLLLLANNIFYSSLFFSVIGAGGVYIGANPASQAFEIEHILQLTKPKIIIGFRDILPKFHQTFEKQGILATNVFVLDPKSFPLPGVPDPLSTPPSPQIGVSADRGPVHWSDLAQLTKHGESDWIRFSREATAKNTPAAMFSTSGTSGLPKVAISSHYALVCQHLSMEQTPQYEVSRLISLPFFHCFAALFAHVWPIRNGQPLHILPRFQLDIFLDAIRRFRITDTIMAPPIVHAINQASSSIQGRLDTLRWAGVGGAPIAAEAMQKFESHLHPTSSLSQVWGMTEIGVATLVRYPERQCWGSIGRPLPGYEMMLVDGFGNVIHNDHEPGSLLVRYYGMMTGYMNHEAYAEGSWYDTGDIMTRVNGKYFVVGRSKELIKVNAWQVAPAELEAVLLSHPLIKDAAVLGVLRDDGVTEVPRAYIVRKEDANGKCISLTADEVYNFARERLASYKALKGGVFFVNDIPRTASGKIQRFKLAEMDQYRRSVTELLIQNNSIVSERKREEVIEIKAHADGVMVPTTISVRPVNDTTSGPNESALPEISETTQSYRKPRISLIGKMKALEASRMIDIA